MSDFPLLEPTGNDHVDAMLKGFVAACETAFPGRIHSYYLSGSQSDHTAVDIGPGNGSSDLDLFALFRDRLEPDEGARFEAFVAALNRFSRTFFDAHPTSEEELTLEDRHPTLLNVLIHRSSLLLYGEDFRPRISPMPFDSYLHHVIVHGIYHIGVLRQGDRPRTWPLKVPLRYPMDYIDPEGEFFGYDHYARGPGREGSLRLLVAITLWCATLELALQTGEVAGRKSEALRLYLERVGGPWSAHVAEVYSSCKREWQHRIPPSVAERAQLREWTRRTLELENRFLEQCRPILLEQLESVEIRRQLQALETLQSVIFPHAGFRERMKALERSKHAEVREAAAASLEVWRAAG